MLTFTSSRRVKIVCTLGPTSEKPEILASLIQEGMDVVRLNFSHGDHSFHKKLFQTLRETAQKAKKPVAIMQDLQGPKLRVGVLQSGVLELKAGDKILLYPEGKTIKQSTKDYIPVPVSPEIAEVIAKCIHQGARILFDDGKISAQAIKISAPEIIAEIETGGKLTNNKGMNLPGTPLPIPCLTEKDLEDLKLGLWLGVDAIALSFVRTDEDIITLRKKIQKITENPPLIIAKIEREEAVENHESILEVTDGLLIARGDMAVELGAARVPTIQKKLIHACNRKGVPVITATQMLESMIYSSTPTRAEASDVANAVFDGTDAVMLSAETATGKYPIEVVKTMNRIVLEAERSQELFTGPSTQILPKSGSVVESIEFSTSRIAQHVGAVAIACLTHSGKAAKVLSKFRPNKPILAITAHERILRQLSFYWGVKGVLIPKILNTDDLFPFLEKVMLTSDFAQVEDLIVVTAGVPTMKQGTTNMIKVHRISAK